jgi:hypothetical protein
MSSHSKNLNVGRWRVKVSVNTRKRDGNTVSRRRKKQLPTQPEAPAQAVVQQLVLQEPNRDFERELKEHFAAEARRKVEEAAENIFGSVLARHGWVRNEHGQVEYVGGDGA